MTTLAERAKAVLGLSGAYRLLQRAIGAEGAYRELLDGYAKPVAGEAVLDVGCGPAEILRLLPDVRYVGVDVDEAYLRTARQNFGRDGEFHLVSADAIGELDGGPFDLILGIGLLHHLPDPVADGFLASAGSSLSESGRLVTIDPCFHPNQSRVARYLVRSDRGQHVRTSERYSELTRRHFPSARIDIRGDLLRVPYAHAIQVAAN